MRKLYITILLCCTVIVTGCSSEVAKLQSFDKKLQQTGEQALLVVKINNFDYLDITRIENSADDAPHQYRILKPQKLFVYNYSQSMYAIEPGRYYISFVAIDSPQGIYYSEAPGLDPHGKVAYGAFDVKPGEVLYLGDIECQWKSTNKIKKLAVLNKLAEVKKDLAFAGRNDLATKIINANFYPGGSTLMMR